MPYSSTWHDVAHVWIRIPEAWSDKSATKKVEVTSKLVLTHAPFIVKLFDFRSALLDTLPVEEGLAMASVVGRASIRRMMACRRCLCSLQVATTPHKYLCWQRLSPFNISPLFRSSLWAQPGHWAQPWHWAQVIPMCNTCWMAFLTQTLLRSWCREQSHC